MPKEVQLSPILDCGVVDSEELADDLVDRNARAVGAGMRLAPEGRLPFPGTRPFGRSVPSSQV